MHPEQKRTWLSHIAEQIDRQRQHIQQLEEARNTAEGKMQSRYDTQKETLNTQVNIGLDILGRLETAKQEIAAGVMCDKVEPGACVEALIDGEPEQLLCLRTKVDLPDVTVVSPQSPIGQAIMGKTPGNKTVYSVGQREFEIEIKGIR